MTLYTSIGLLILLAILTYMVMQKVQEVEWQQKRKRLSSFIEVQKKKEVDEYNSSFYSWLEDRGIMTYVNPKIIMAEAEAHGMVLTKRSFTLTFLFGTVIAFVIFIVYLQPIIELVPLALIGGLIAVNVRLHQIKKRYITEIDAKLAVYMSSLSTSLKTFENTKDSFNSIIDGLESPVKEDVEKAMLHLQDGKDIRYAFSEMVKKYPQKEVKLFHDQLDALIKGGSVDIQTLSKIAFKMKKKETYRRKLKTAHKQQVKVWRTFVFLTMSIPFIFMIVSTDNFTIVMNHIATTIVYLFNFLMIFFTWRKLEELEIYDPTNDQNIDFT